MAENNDLLSLWYGYILNNWLYFEESDDVKVSEDGKRASSISVDAMKAAIKAKRNPTTEEREADVFFRRTVEIPDSENSDKCHVLQEAGQFTYRIMDELLINPPFLPCVTLNEVLAWIRANVEEERDDGYVNDNPTGIEITYDSNVNLPNLSDNDVFYKVDKSIPLYVPTNSIPAYKAAKVWNSFTNIQAIPNTALTDGETYIFESQLYGHDISYTRTFYNTNWQALYIPFSCNGGSVDFRMNQDSCYGGEVGFKLKIKGFKAKLSSDLVKCSKCGKEISTKTQRPDVNIEIETKPINIHFSHFIEENEDHEYILNVAFGRSQNSINYSGESENISCSGGNVSFYYSEGSTSVITPDKTLNGCNSDNVNFSVHEITSECVDECKVYITWADGHIKSEKIWPLASGRNSIIRPTGGINIIEFLPNNF